MPVGQLPADSADTPTVKSKLKSAELAAINTAVATGAGSIDSEITSSADTVVVSSDDIVGSKLASDGHHHGDAAAGTGGTDAKLDDAADVVGVDVQPAKVSQPISRTISYHQNADLCLRIRDKAGNTHNLKVCAALLAGALPTLGDLSACVDVASSGERVLDLDGFQNNHQGLDIILSIIHYKFHEIPARPEIDQLYSIAQIVEKYDCAHLVLPYMEKWAAGVNWHITMEKEIDDDKTLLLAWVFGESHFVRMLSRVAHKATLDDEGVLLDTRGQPWKDHGLPPAILELIAKTRFDCLAKVVQAVNGPLQELMGSSKNTSKFCRTKDTNGDLKQACEYQQLGSLVSGLSAADLLPFPTAAEYRGSVVALAAKVWAIKINRFKLPGTPPHLDAHNTCGINHKEAVESAMKEDVRLISAIIEELNVRGLKSGAFVPNFFKDCENEAKTPLAIHRDLRLNGVYYKQETVDS
ncbi:hypothetical protein C8A05DRAFT_12173 [Staphylotrichum tortipilum]|uniref:Uncharacterized protein n=1 Tax=Staphylotrichum tortipilum TaxID=2831512 RepID=A0AAN6MSZ0_9PEZI|nr:hypothetical protein C8A05DRAFT_12173 [Staphylotrichum longicolle]